MAAEKNFENRVKKFLKDKGAWFVKYWGGASMNGKSFTKSGIPDLLVCCNGSFVAVELKAEKGKPSDLQLYNLKQIDRSGGYAVLLYPEHFELFKNFVDCILYNDLENRDYNYDLLKSKWKHFENK